MQSNKEIYRVSIAKNLKSSTLIIGLILLFVGINVYLFKSHPYYNLKVFLYSILVFLPPLGIALFVHIEYLIRNWKATLEVNQINKKIRYKDETKQIVACFDDITRIIKHKAKDTALLYWFYEYSEIHLKTGEILIITNLMARNFSIPGVEVETIDRYFPSVWLYNNISSK